MGWIVKVCGNNGLYGWLEFGSSWEIMSVHEVKNEKMLKILTIFVNSQNGNFEGEMNENKDKVKGKDNFK